MARSCSVLRVRLPVSSLVRARVDPQVVFDAQPILDGFPASLEAFVLPYDGGEEGRRYVRAKHRAFLDAFGTTADEVPLLAYNDHGAGPFSVPAWGL